MTAQKLKLFSMNNRNSESSVPAGKSRNAYNVLFDNEGKVLFPRIGKMSCYAGTNIHSVFDPPFITLFVENGSLKKLNPDNTATTLKTGLGSTKVFYTVVGESIFFCNEAVTGKVVNGVAIEWGVARPPTQPTLTAITAGGMYEGAYRVAITWIGTEEESGAISSVSVSVPEGGGIVLSSFPTPPAYATLVAVYVSSVNSEDLYLYGEYAIATTSVTINRLDANGELPTIPIETQFMFPPVPTKTILAHYGRIYYFIGNILYCTEAHRYGLQKSGNYWTFDSDIQTIVSCPNVLYVGTETAIYKIAGIDSEDSPPMIEQQQNCGTVKYSECADPDGVSSYFMSNRGFIAATPEELTELSYKDVAIPYYASGSMTVIEQDSMKHLMFTGSGGTVNPLQHSTFTTDYATIPTAWFINLENGGISNGSSYFDSMSSSLGTNSDGLYNITGSTDNGTGITGFIETGKLEFKVTENKRATDAYISKKGGKLKLDVTAGGQTIAYQFPTTTRMETVKSNLARGIKDRYFKFKLSNVSGSEIQIDDVEFEIERLSRRV